MYFGEHGPCRVPSTRMRRRSALPVFVNRSTRNLIHCRVVSVQMEIGVSKEYIRKLPLFKWFSGEGIERLVEALSIIELPRYSVIHIQDDYSDGAYIVRKGLVKTTKLLPSGKECTLDLFFPGEPFGLRALFGPSSRPSNALTIEPSILLFLPQKELGTLGADLVNLRNNVFQIVDEHLRSLENRFSDLAHRSLRERLAMLLVMLSSRLGRKNGDQPVLPLSQWELANLIGSTRESVSVTLNHFKREGLISLKRRHVRIEKIEGLLSIAEIHHAG